MHLCKCELSRVNVLGVENQSCVQRNLSGTMGECAIFKFWCNCSNNSIRMEMYCSSGFESLDYFYNKLFVMNKHALFFSLRKLSLLGVYP